MLSESIILTAPPQPCSGVRVGVRERIRAQWVYWSRGLEYIGAGQNGGVGVGILAESRANCFFG